MHEVNLTVWTILTNFVLTATEKGTMQARVFSFMGSPTGGGTVLGGGRGPGRNGTMRGAGRSGGRGRGTNNAPVHANKATTGTSSNGAKGGQSHALMNSGEPTGISGITPAQWQQLLDALNDPKTKDRLHGIPL
ncbi:hypothetical protein SESBI_16726 [Sesbania bispinosa]|nr:hypothetical protein SESBI_16726 [Sesbania bispinosa]